MSLRLRLGHVDPGDLRLAMATPLYALTLSPAEARQTLEALR